MFDLARNYVAFTDSEGIEHNWDYDENNRVEYVRYNGAVVSRNYYTPGGLLDYTDTFSSAGTEIARTTYTYDGLGRRIQALTERTAVSPTEVLADLRWEYNTRNQVTRTRLMHLGGLSWDISYDNRGNLTEESTSGNDGSGASLEIEAVGYQYAYDPADNRISKSENSLIVNELEYDAGSRLITEAGSNRSVSYEYDGWGNVVTKSTTEGQTQTIETFGYNYMNRLSSYVRDVGGTVVANWQYDYWPTGDRQSKTNLGDAGNPNDDASTLFLCRNSDIATVFSQSASGAPAHSQTYVQGVGIDSKILRIAADGARRHFISDLVGTVEMTLNDGGQTQEECLRDTWGNSIAGDTSDERFAFAQREFDNEPDLIYMRGRMYDPTVGRFMQVDPLIGNRATEHYLYAGNNPILYRDPLGLETTYAEAVRYFKLLFGKEGEALLEAFRRYGGVWEFGDVSGDVDVDYWFRSNLAIQIEEDVSPFEAAQLMRKGLEEALPYYGSELLFSKGFADNIDAVMRWHSARAQEAASCATAVTELALAGVGIVNEGADWVMTVDEMSKGNWSASLGFLPFVPSGTVKLVNKERKLLGTYDAKTGKFHHSATNKNKQSAASGGPWTPIFEALFAKAGMSLDDADNLVKVVGHKGPHPEEYHQAVFDRLYGATKGLRGAKYAEALRAELRVLAKEMQTPGSMLNKLLTE